MHYVAIPFGYVMRVCYNLLSNYGLAIVLFTFLTKIILFPISLWTHNNSIRLIRIQPELNMIKAKYFGEKDKISDEQLELYKREKYHPLAGLIPMILQIFLLMCVIQIIYNPLSYLLSFDASTVQHIVDTVCGSLGLDAGANSIQLTVVKEIQNGFLVDNAEAITALNMDFLGFDLSATPMSAKGKMLLVPVLAGGCALALCLFQNKMNPLQAEQGRGQQISTNVVSVGISLILGGFVPAGIGLYWIFSNLFTMVQQLVLNVVINPKKHIDYDALEKSKIELEKISAVGKDTSAKFGSEIYKREKADYKRFFSVANKHLVIYSENNGFFKYYKRLIDYLLQNSNIVIHYVTSDPNDNIFELAKANEKIKAYYIGEKKLITLFMKMDADIVLMTMPDLENFHYKRSYIKKDVEYIYIFHGPTSTHMVMNNHCLDNYDTIFCVGDFHVDEIRKQEEIYNLPEKKAVVCGYGFLETLQEQYDAMDKVTGKKVLIAPSWQEDNILDSCIDDVLSELLGKGFNVVVRPHPEYKKRYAPRLDALVERYKDYKGGDLSFELDFTSSDSIYNSDVVITDWSAICYEFSYVTLKPCVYIDTPPKVYNKEYQQLGIEPLEIKLRSICGEHFAMDNVSGMAEKIDYMINNREEYSQKIENARNTYVANYGKSGEVAGKYIINALIEKQRQRKDK